MGSEWRSRPLGELVENLDALRVPVKEAERKAGPFPYYGASGVVDFVDQYIFDGEYLLIAEDGENLRTRKTPVAFLARGKFWVNNHAHIVRGNSEADTRFLMYFLSGADISGYLTGSTMPKLTQRALHRIPVLAPPLDEQRRIAAVLGALDDKIELNRRMNRTLEEMAQALFKSWFIDFDGVPASDLVDSELGPIPKGWEVKSLGDFVELQRGKTYKSQLLGEAGPVLLGLGTIQPGGGFRSEKLKTYGGDSPEALLVRPGDLYASLKGATKDGDMVGSVARVPFWVKVGRLTQDTVRLDFSDNRARELIYWMLRSPDCRAYFGARTTGSAQVGLSRSDFLGYQIAVPADLNEIAPVSDLMSWLGQKSEQNDAESRTLADLRDTLLPKLISGELRVPEAEALVEAAL